jgi:hypothetical protein
MCYPNFPLNYPATSWCRSAGFAPKLDAKRGFDHGAFVPLKLAFPAADIPVIQLSLLSSLDPQVMHGWHPAHPLQAQRWCCVAMQICVARVSALCKEFH